jgi:hypothetical protein
MFCTDDVDQAEDWFHVKLLVEVYAWFGNHRKLCGACYSRHKLSIWHEPQLKTCRAALA